MQNKWVKVAVIAAFVVIPTLFVLFLANAKWVHKKLPYFSRELTQKDSSQFAHKVNCDIEFVDHNGRKFNFKDYDTNIWVVNIFFANCPDVCPEMNKQVQSVAETFSKRGDKRVRFLTITIDPERDSVSVLKRVANSFNADSVNRLFVTGNKKEIYDWVLNEALLANKQEGQNFIHDDKVVIIDKERHIRAILETRVDPSLVNNNANKMNLLKRIEEDIDNLIYEYRQRTYK